MLLASKALIKRIWPPGRDEAVDQCSVGFPEHGGARPAAGHADEMCVCAKRTRGVAALQTNRPRNITYLVEAEA